MGYFRQNPERYPDGPIRTLVRQMSHRIGIPIHYYAVTNMTGLREVHLDGQRALMYVRSRYGLGNNDFVRARRQQQVIRALAQ